jgi:hypothetical protein
MTTLPIADVRKPGGPAIILDALLNHLNKEYNWIPGSPEIMNQK